MPPPEQKAKPKKSAKRDDDQDLVVAFRLNGRAYRFELGRVSDRDEIALWRASGKELMLADLGEALQTSAQRGHTAPPRFALAGLMFLAARQAGDPVEFDWCSEQLRDITEISFGEEDEPRPEA